MSINRSWTWQDVRTYLQGLNEQSSSTFYQGPEPSTATDPLWSDVNSLMGGRRLVMYANISVTNSVTMSGSGLSLTGSGLTVGVS